MVDLTHYLPILLFLAVALGITAYGGAGNDLIAGSQAGDHIAGGSGDDGILGGRRPVAAKLRNRWGLRSARDDKGGDGELGAAGGEVDQTGAQDLGRGAMIGRFDGDRDGLVAGNFIPQFFAGQRGRVSGHVQIGM